MKKCVLLVGLLIGMIPLTAVSSVVVVSGTLSGDTTWTPGDTILIPNYVRVPALTKLTIDAGTIIQFGTGASLVSSGSVEARGAELDPIIFTSRADTTGGAPAPGYWLGFHAQSGSQTDLEFCHLRYGVNAISVDDAHATLTDCLVENFMSQGIALYRHSALYPPEVIIDRCLVGQTSSASQLLGIGIYVYSTVHVLLRETEVHGFTNGIHLEGCASGAPVFELDRCDVHDNGGSGIYLYAST